MDVKEVIQAISLGILDVYSDADIFPVLASDGDGFLNSVSENVATIKIVANTIDPIGRKIQSEYLFDRPNKTAYIELAKASGLSLLQKADCNVTVISTFGTGLLIRHALKEEHR